MKIRIALIALIAGIIIGIAITKSMPKDYTSIGVFSPKILSYENGSLVALYNETYNFEVAFNVESEELKKELENTDVSEIIGISFTLEIPAKVAKKHNINYKTDAFMLMQNKEFHKYLTVTEIHK